MLPQPAQFARGERRSATPLPVKRVNPRQAASTFSTSALEGKGSIASTAPTISKITAHRGNTRVRSVAAPSTTQPTPKDQEREQKAREHRPRAPVRDSRRGLRQTRHRGDLAPQGLRRQHRHDQREEKLREPERPERLDLPNVQRHEADRQQQHGEQLRPVREEGGRGGRGLAETVAAHDDRVKTSENTPSGADGTAGTPPNLTRPRYGTFFLVPGVTA